MVYVGLIYFLMFGQEISQLSIRIQLGIFNIIAGGAVLYVIIFYFSKYLYTPFKSSIARDKLMRLSKIVIIFTLGRFYKGMIGLLEVDISSSFLIDLYEIENSTIQASLMLITTYLICEILAFVFVLDYGFIYIFLFPEDEFLQYSGLYHRKTIVSDSREIYSMPSDKSNE